MDFDDILSASLSAEQLHEVDQRCDRFLAMYQAGQSPRPADFACGLDDQARDYLLEQLHLLQQELQDRSAVPGNASAPTPESGLAAGATAPLAAENTITDLPSAWEHSAAPAADAPRQAEDAGQGEQAADARSVGRYRVLRLHAEGGLGIVFAAHDCRLNREVALKEIRAEHTANPETCQRFTLEAEITGSLEHPGIVPVYSLEEHEDGRPYYAMRLIRGESLREAIRRFHADEDSGGNRQSRNLDLRKLLARFVDVCNAVQYAHSRHVLHRDLKPDNVMLGDYGETLLVDWGLAKRMRAKERRGNGQGAGQEGEAGERRGEASASSSGPPSWETQTGLVLGTPAYMSPEQAAGKTDRLGPASDIYSLGATLYCLLTGSPPFADAEIAGTLAKARAGEFPRPRTIRPATPKPLEAICLKALAWDPARRYESARALAEDIERYLGDEPVTAWREPLATRVRRRVQRHRTPVALAVGLLLVAGAGLVSYVQQRVRVAEQAHALLRKAEEAWQAPGGGVPSPERLWQFGQQAQTLADSPSLAPPLRGQLLGMARDYRLLQRLDDAERAKSELNVRRNAFNLTAALPEYRRAFQEYGIDPERTSVAEAAQILGQRPARVRLILIAALDDWAALLRGQAGANPPVGPAASLSSAAEPQAGNARPVAATRIWLEALADRVDPDPLRNQLRQAIRGDENDALERLAQQAEMLEQPPRVLKLVASVLGKAGRLEASVGLLRRAQRKCPSDFWINHDLALSLRLLSPPQHGEALRFYAAALAIRPDAQGVLLNFGVSLHAAGYYDEAAEMFRRAIELQDDYAEAYGNLAVTLQKQGQIDEAMRHYGRAIELKPDSAEAHYNLGNALSEQGKLDEAIQQLHAATQLNPDWAEPWFNRGVILQKQGQVDEAIREYRQATELQPDAAGFRCRLAQALAVQGHVDEAVLQCRRVIERNPVHAEAYCELGIAFTRQGKLEEAIAEYRKAIDLQPDYVEAHGNLGAALDQQGKASEAIEQYRKVLALQPDGAITYYNLGNVLKTQGQLDEAIADYRRALELDPAYAEAHCNLAGALRELGRFAESLAEYRQGHRAGSQRPHWPYPSEQWVQGAEQLVALENKLPAIVAGEARPADAAERLRLTNEICLPKQLYRTAVRLFQEAFAADARLADQSAHRYNAACCAALAGSGQGHGAESLDDAERAQLRQQAIRWLQAEFVRYSPALANANPQLQAESLAQLRRWQSDRDLSGIREADQLDALPVEERTAWQRFWTEVRLSTRR